MKDKIPPVMNERAKRERHPKAIAQITAGFEKWTKEGLLLFAQLKSLFKNKKTKILNLNKS